MTFSQLIEIVPEFSDVLFTLYSKCSSQGTCFVSRTYENSDICEDGCEAGYCKPKPFCDEGSIETKEIAEAESKNVNGVEITVLDRDNFKPVDFGVALLVEFSKNSEFRFLEREFIDKLWGSNDLRNGNINSRNWQKDLEKFQLIRIKYLIYK